MSQENELNKTHEHAEAASAKNCGQPECAGSEVGNCGPQEPSQDTRIGYVEAVLWLRDDIANANPRDAAELCEMRDDWIFEISGFADESLGDYDDLPPECQLDETGEMLLKRAKGMKSWADRIKEIDFVWDEGIVTWEVFARKVLDKIVAGCPIKAPDQRP